MGMTTTTTNNDGGGGSSNNHKSGPNGHDINNVAVAAALLNGDPNGGEGRGTEEEGCRSRKANNGNEEEEKGKETEEEEEDDDENKTPCTPPPNPPHNRPCVPQHHQQQPPPPPPPIRVQQPAATTKDDTYRTFLGGTSPEHPPSPGGSSFLRSGQRQQPQQPPQLQQQRDTDPSAFCGGTGSSHNPYDANGLMNKTTDWSCYDCNSDSGVNPTTTTTTTTTAILQHARYDNDPPPPRQTLERQRHVRPPPPLPPSQPQQQQQHRQQQQQHQYAKRTLYPTNVPQQQQQLQQQRTASLASFTSLQNSRPDNAIVPPVVVIHVQQRPQYYYHHQGGIRRTDARAVHAPPLYAAAQQSQQSPPPPPAAGTAAPTTQYRRLSAPGDPSPPATPVANRDDPPERRERRRLQQTSPIGLSPADHRNRSSIYRPRRPPVPTTPIPSFLQYATCTATPSAVAPPPPTIDPNALGLTGHAYPNAYRHPIFVNNNTINGINDHATYPLFPGINGCQKTDDLLNSTITNSRSTEDGEQDTPASKKQRVEYERDAIWERRFAELVAYKRQHGDCNVPRQYAPNPELGIFVVTNRTQYKSWISGKRQLRRQQSKNKHAATRRLSDASSTDRDQGYYPSHYMTRNRFVRLNAIGFCWETAKEQRARAAETAVATTEETLKGMKSVGIVSNARCSPRHPGKQGRGQQRKRSGPIACVGRASPLDTDVWETRFSELLRYRNEVGDCNVPVRYKRSPVLGRWVGSVRREYKLMNGKGNTQPRHLTRERVRRLESVGFQWVARKRDASHERIIDQLCKGLYTGHETYQHRPTTTRPLPQCNRH